MKRLAVLTSGGDAPGMNAAIRFVAKLGADRGIGVLGIEDGYAGLMAGRFCELTAGSPEEGFHSRAELDLAAHQGGTLLGSARSQRFMTEEGMAAAVECLGEVDGLIVIGGNGSLAGAHELAQRTSVPVVGIPATIDNDVGCTSTAIGVDTALNTIVSACDRISDTARAHHRAFVIEVMGRQSGYLAMAAAITAGADGVLTREQGRDQDAIVDAVEQLIRRSFADAGRKRVLILKSEGVEMPCTRLVRQVQARLIDVEGVEVRATVLGHLVRGGSPSHQDRMVAARLVFHAVAALEQGVTDQMVSWLPQQVEGGIETGDPSVQRFSLDAVLRESRALLDGTSAVTRWRVSRMQAVSTALPV